MMHARPSKMKLQRGKTLNRSKMAMVMAAVALISASQAGAQAIGERPARSQDDLVFDRTVEAYATSGRAHIYQCKGPTGEYRAEDQHSAKLVRIAKEMSAGDEVAVAARSGCMRYNPKPTRALSGDRLLALADKTPDAIWLIGEVAESYPEATGYTFEAIVRIPRTPPAQPGMRAAVMATPAKPLEGSAGAAVARVDADYMRRFRTRSMGGSDEGSGYDVCPSAAAIDAVLDTGTATAEDVRDERMMEASKRKGCHQGDHLLSGIRARRHVESMGTHWYAATGIEKGRPVNVIVWTN